MKFVSVLVVCGSLIAHGVCFGQTSVVATASQHEQQGKFKEAAKILQNASANKSLGQAESKQMEFELDRLERIKKDYPYTKAELFSALKKSVKDLTMAEFERWNAEGRFDTREIDGERRFMSSSVSNLFFRYPELTPRRIPPKDTTQHDRAVWEICAAILIKNMFWN